MRARKNNEVLFFETISANFFFRQTHSRIPVSGRFRFGVDFKPFFGFELEFCWIRKNSFFFQPRIKILSEKDRNKDMERLTKLISAKIINRSTTKKGTIKG